MRTTLLRLSLASSLVLGAIAIGASGLVSTTGPVPTGPELHAPRLPGPSPTTVVPGTAVREWVSSNWSGSALSGTGLRSVTGNWRVPQVLRPKKTLRRKNLFSSSWVGIDGYNNAHLIQAGTEQDWLAGTPFYRAWWEILPAPETPITSLTISPGDAITVSINQGASDWTITVADTTTGQSFTTHQTYSGPGTSAEWIQEAPTIGTHVALLAPCGTVTFDPGTLDGGSPGLVSADQGVLVKAGKRISTPSQPDSDQDGFSVSYGSVPPASPPS